MHHDPATTDPTAPEDSDPAAAVILRLVAARGPAKSICVSEAARELQAQYGKAADDREAWRRYLPAVRQQAKNLARRGRIRILRKGRPVDPHKPVKGVIRLAAVHPGGGGAPGDAG